MECRGNQSGSGTEADHSMRRARRSASSSASVRKRPKPSYGQGPPLPRGQACVTCRHRKMRCSGTLPSCGHCARRNERCVYDYEPEHWGANFNRAFSDRSNSTHEPLSTGPSPLPSFEPQLQPQPQLYDLEQQMPMAGFHAQAQVSAAGGSIVPPSQLSNHSMLQLLPPSYMPGPSQVDTMAIPLAPAPASLRRSSSHMDVAITPSHVITPGIPLPGPSTAFSFSAPASNAALTVRDLFISQFFSPTSIYHTRGAVNELRYRTRLSFSPDLQPNKSLQHAICLLGAASTVPEDISRTQKLYGLAKAALEEELAFSRFPVDSIIASHMLATWLWRYGRLAEGYMLNGRALQLALVCGLERIPSATWLESSQLVEEPTGMPNHLVSAGDAIELSERIQIFHAVVAMDLGASLTTQWPAMSTAVSALTPLPMPSLVSMETLAGNDVATPSLIGRVNPSMCSGAHCSVESASILALHLLYRVSQLPTLPGEQAELSERGSPQHGSSMPSPESNAPDSPRSPETCGRPAAWSRTPRFRTPATFRMLRDSLDALANQLPLQLMDSREWDVAVLHIFINAAKMALYDIRGDSIDHDEAYRKAITCAGLINSLKYNIFRPGIFGPFTAVPWLMVLKVLHAESKREQRLHRDNEATAASATAREVLTALQARALSCGTSLELARRGAHLMKD